MPGFYVNHLKSMRAKTFAIEIEKRLATPISDKNMDTIIQFKTADKQDLNEILSAGYAVLRDHPEFFYYKTSLKSYFDGNQVTLKFRLLYTPSEITTLKTRIEHKLSEILNLIPRDACTWEKERILFEYLQLNTTYTDDGAPERYNIIGALLNGQAVCEGISKAFAVLCHRIGIPCIVVFSKTHMWNLVNINGRLSNVDVTYTTNTPHTFCDYTYFNVSDSDMNNDEHCKELECIPNCLDNSNNYYAKMNLYFQNEQELKKYITRSLFACKSPIYVKLSKGNIVRAIKSATLLAPYNITFTYNESAKTALITSA